jgi:hypothetical protein
MRINNIFPLVIIFLLLIGCSKSVGRTGQVNFKQGISELSLSFLENAPPENIYPDSEFSIVVKLENQAAYGLTEGSLKMVGLDEKYFFVTPTEQSLRVLEGRSLANPDGDKEFVEFSGRSGGLFQNAEKYTGNFFMKVDYNSEMEFSDTVCINANVYDVYDSGCKVEQFKSYSGQGAPLAITKMEEIVGYGGSSPTEFRFTLKNRGNGKVGNVIVRSAFIGGKELPCQFKGVEGIGTSISFKEDKQEATLVCKKLMSQQGSYETAMSLKFVYDYSIKQKHTLTLVR